MLSIPERYARREETRRLALDLMGSHGLADWSFGFNQRKRSMGLCRYARKAIELSSHFVYRNGSAEIRDTILHEIAHALVGQEHGHDAVWQAKCREIGATPRRCGPADMPQGHWQARCGSCSSLFSRHRRPKTQAGWFCRACGPERGKLLWQLACSSGR
jgi:predicted SprT family Zn-dependent metalloprotease